MSLRDGDYLGEVRMTHFQHLGFLGPSCHPLTSTLGVEGKTSFSPYLQVEDRPPGRARSAEFRGRGQQGPGGFVRRAAFVSFASISGALSSVQFLKDPDT